MPDFLLISVFLGRRFEWICGQSQGPCRNKDGCDARHLWSESIAAQFTTY